MNKEELLVAIKTLKETQKDIQIKLDAYENELKTLDTNSQEKVNILDANTEDGYYSYLTITKKLNDHTVHNYFSYLRGIKKRLMEYSNYKIEGEIYNISDKTTLLEIKLQMENCPKLQKDNITQHNSFTASFNNYIDYIFNSYKKPKKELHSDFEFDD